MSRLTDKYCLDVLNTLTRTLIRRCPAGGDYQFTKAICLGARITEWKVVLLKRMKGDVEIRPRKVYMAAVDYETKDSTWYSSSTQIDPKDIRSLMNEYPYGIFDLVVCKLNMACAEVLALAEEESNESQGND